MAQVVDTVYDTVKPLSEKLRSTIPQLKDDEVAVFRLKNAFRQEGGREEPSSPEYVKLSGQHTILDPFEPVFDENGNHKKDSSGKLMYKKVTKIIGSYVTEYKDLNGRTKPIYAGLEFKRGELRLTAADQALYEYAMRRLDNETNKYRKQMGAKVTPKFFLVGTKELVSPMQAADMRFFAERMVRESSFQNLREMAAKLNQGPDTRLHIKSFIAGVTGDPKAMQYEMIVKAQQYPKQIMSVTPDLKTQLRVQIYDAFVYGILMFDRGAYQLDKDAEFIELFKPEADAEKDKLESFIDYLMSDDGKDNYLLFAQTLKKVLEVSKN